MARVRIVRRGPRFVIRRITTIGIVILGCVFAGESHAGPGCFVDDRDLDIGARVPCVTPSGCVGERECLPSGQMSGCGSLGCDDSHPVACTTACGTRGTQLCDVGCNVVASCTAPEACNGCDDDGDGVADDGLFRCGTGPFQQLDCASPVNVRYVFDSRDNFDRDPNSPQNYANNIDFRWTIVTNRFVDTLDLEFLEFRTEQDDQLVIVVPGGMTEVNAGRSARLGAHSYPLRGEGQGTPVRLRFLSDDNESDTGFFIAGATLTCGASGSLVAPRVAPMERVEGFLLDTGDTVFLELDGSSALTYLVLDGFPEDADFDFYTCVAERCRRRTGSITARST